MSTGTKMAKTTKKSKSSISARIVRCPICNTRLQATLVTWSNEVALSLNQKDGSVSVTSWGMPDIVLGCWEEESRYYCENDHTADEIAKALKVQWQERQGS